MRQPEFAEPWGEVTTVLVAAVLALTGAAAPPLPAEVMASPFGVVNPWPEVGRGGMGAVWCRCGGGSTALGDWPRMMPLAGAIRWDDAEREWQHYYVKEALVPCPILSYTPRWASRAPAADDFNRYPPADLWDYYRFCRAVAARFAGRVWFWEVWNEPNIGFFNGTIAEYTDLLKAGALGVAAGSPGACVIFGGTAGVDVPFISRCYGYGARDYFDVAAVHPYQWGKVFDDGWMFRKLAALRALLRDRGDETKPVWLNEFGWSTADTKITDDDQARLLVQCFVSAIARRDLGVERAFWFCVKDWGGPGYGLYDARGHKKPAWYAYRAMVARLRGTRCLGRLNVGPAARAWVFAVPSAPNCVVVLWAAGLEAVPITLKLAAAPVGLYTLTGQPAEPPKAVGERVTLTATPAPVYLVVPREAVAPALEPVKPLHIALPDPARRKRVWLSLYPQAGCSLPWLWRGRRTRLRARLFNASTESLRAEVQVAVLAPDGRELASTRRSVAVGPMADAVFTVAVPCPKDAPPRVRLLATAYGTPAAGVQTDCFASDGPTVNFLANSFLERRWYLQPDGRSGTAESVRFGSQWTYKIPVPAPGAAVVEMNVGANGGRRWSVQWSEDAKTWRPLYAGRSTPGWHSAQIAPLRGRFLYLRCQGEDQQVREVIVRFLPARDAGEPA